MPLSSHSSDVIHRNTPICAQQRVTDCVVLRRSNSRVREYSGSGAQRAQHVYHTREHAVQLHVGTLPEIPGPMHSECQHVSTDCKYVIGLERYKARKFNRNAASIGHLLGHMYTSSGMSWANSCGSRVRAAHGSGGNSEGQVLKRHQSSRRAIVPSNANFPSGWVVHRPLRSERIRRTRHGRPVGLWPSRVNHTIPAPRILSMLSRELHRLHTHRYGTLPVSRDTCRCIPCAT